MVKEPRSPALSRICDAAVQHFSVAGYDGASLNEIAGMVGIKKASLYSHFASKDALFLFVLEDAARIERDFACETVDGSMPAGPGSAYVEAIGERHAASVHLRFLLRAAFLPPVALRSAIGDVYLGYLEALRGAFLRQLPTSLSQVDAESFGHAYIGIVESLFLELTYCDSAQMAIRRRALWRIFQDSMSLRC